MEEVEKRESEDLEILDIGIEVKEFIRETEPHRTDAGRMLKKKKRRRNRASYRTSYAWIWLLAWCINFLVVVLCSIFFLKISLVTALLAVVFEAVLVVCFYGAPPWLHVLVLLLNIILGIWFSMTVFMMLCSEIYLAGILMMCFRR